MGIERCCALCIEYCITNLLFLDINLLMIICGIVSMGGLKPS